MNVALCESSAEVGVPFSGGGKDDGSGSVVFDSVGSRCRGNVPSRALPLACGAGLKTPEERLAGGVGVGETDPCGLRPFDSETGRGLKELVARKRTVAFWVPVGLCEKGVSTNSCKTRMRQSWNRVADVLSGKSSESLQV